MRFFPKNLTFAFLFSYIRVQRLMPGDTRRMSMDREMIPWALPLPNARKLNSWTHNRKANYKPKTSSDITRRPTPKPHDPKHNQHNQLPTPKPQPLTSHQPTANSQQQPPNNTQQHPTTHNQHRTPHNEQRTTNSEQRTANTEHRTPTPYNLHPTTNNQQPTTNSHNPTTHNLFDIQRFLNRPILSNPATIFISSPSWTDRFSPTLFSYQTLSEQADFIQPS